MLLRQGQKPPWAQGVVSSNLAAPTNRINLSEQNPHAQRGLRRLKPYSQLRSLHIKAFPRADLKIAPPIDYNFNFAPFMAIPR